MKICQLLLFLVIDAVIAQRAMPSTRAPVEKTRFIKPLSIKAKRIYQKVYVTALMSPSRSGIPAQLIGTSGKLKGQVAEYGDVPKHCEELFYPAMKKAKEEILITTFLYDRGSPCANITRKAIIELNRDFQGKGKKLKVFMIISTVSAVSFWNKPHVRIPSPKRFVVPLQKIKPEMFDLPSELDLPNIDFRVKTFHRSLVGAIHSKLLIVDGHIFVAGSKNLDAFEGFEYANWLEGAVATSARSDFQDAWRDTLPPAPNATVRTAKPGDYSILYLPRTTSHELTNFNEDNPQDQAWLTAMDVAQDHVFIMTPSFNCKTIFDKVIEVVQKGIKVTIITNFKYEDRAQRLYPDNVGDNIKTVQEVYKRIKDHPNADLLDVCYFLGNRVNPPLPAAKEVSHVKFMSVDDEFYIFGSGNHDAQSWHHSREVNLLIDDPRKTVEMRQLLMSRQNSLKICFRDEKGLVNVGDVDPWHDDQ